MKKDLLKDHITEARAKQALKEKYNISDNIMRALIYAKYDFKENDNKDFSYTEILERLCSQITKEFLDEIHFESYDGLDAR